DRLLGVEPHRRRDVDGVDFGIDDELAPARVPALRAALASDALDPIGARAADGHQLAVARLPQRARDALTDYVAGTNQTPTNHVRVQGSGFRVQGSRSCSQFSFSF